MSDVKQGMFGDCYLLSVLAGITQQPGIMQQVLESTMYSELVSQQFSHSSQSDAR